MLFSLTVCFRPSNLKEYFYKLSGEEDKNLSLHLHLQLSTWVHHKTAGLSIKVNTSLLMVLVSYLSFDVWSSCFETIIISTGSPSQLTQHSLRHSIALSSHMARPSSIISKVSTSRDIQKALSHIQIPFLPERQPSESTKVKAWCPSFRSENFVF
jgi:hypothetical protein